MGRAQREGRDGVARGGRHRGGVGRAAQLACLAVLAFPLLAGCAAQDLPGFGWPQGVTPQAENMRTLWVWSVVAALVVGAITWGAMGGAMIFHR